MFSSPTFVILTAVSPVVVDGSHVVPNAIGSRGCSEGGRRHDPSLPSKVLAWAHSPKRSMRSIPWPGTTFRTSALTLTGWLPSNVARASVDSPGASSTGTTAVSASSDHMGPLVATVAMTVAMSRKMRK